MSLNTKCFKIQFHRLPWWFSRLKIWPCRGHVVQSCPGTKIPHAMGQLSPRTTTREPMLHNKDPRATKYIQFQKIYL